MPLSLSEQPWTIRNLHTRGPAIRAILMVKPVTLLPRQYPMAKQVRRKFPIAKLVPADAAQCFEAVGPTKLEYQ